MNCRSARAAAVDSGLGLLTSRRRSALEQHLARCPGCASALRMEELLVQELSALGQTRVFEVDVTTRVLAELTPTGQVSREDVPARQLGWAAAAAALATVIVLGSLAGQWQQIEALLVSGATIASKLLGFADVLVAPLIGLLSFLVRLAGFLGESLVDLAGQASRFEPIAWIVVSLGYGLMASTVVLVLFKDLTRPLAALPRGRN